MLVLKITAFLDGLMCVNRHLLTMTLLFIRTTPRLVGINFTCSPRLRDAYDRISTSGEAEGIKGQSFCIMVVL